MIESDKFKSMEKILKEIDIKEESVSLKYGAIISLKHLYNGQYIYVEGFINLADADGFQRSRFISALYE